MSSREEELLRVMSMQHAMIEEIVAAFEHGTTSLNPFFLARHIAVLRRRAEMLAMDVRNACDDTSQCPNCGMECTYARYIEEFELFETERKAIMDKMEEE